jgi:putative ABC transport system permease protein
MRNVAFASLLAHKRRLIGMFLSVVLGVAFLSGTLVLGDTMQSGFDSIFADANAGTDTVVQPKTEIDSDYANGKGSVPLSVADEIRGVDGVAAVAPYVEGFGRILDSNGDPLGGNGPPTLAGSWTTDEQLNAYRIAEGRAPEAPDEVVINRGAAEDGDLHVGDTTIVQMPDPVTVKIVGIAAFGDDEDGIGPVTMAFFTMPAAQQYIMGNDTKVTSIKVRAADGVSQDALTSRIAPTLPRGVEAVSGQDLTNQQLDQLGEDFLNFFKTFLVVFAVIALLVATFSIHNTFTILVAQRTRESALLRSIGASRRQILSWVVIEAFVVGAIASALGLFGGLGLAAGLKALFSGFGFSFPASGLVFQAATVVTCMVVGIGLTMLAGIGPALKASRVAPLAALRDVAVDRTSASLLRAVAGAFLLFGGIAVVIEAVLAEAPIGIAGLGAAMTIAGVAVFGPVVARPASRVIGAPLARLRGITGSLARRNAMRNPRRTAGTATALMVGVGVVTLFTVFAASMKESIRDSVAGSLRSDYVIGGLGWNGGSLSPQLTSDIAQLPDVDRAVGLGSGFALVDGDSEPITVADPAQLEGIVDLDVQDGSITDLRTAQLAVSEQTADDNDWKIGTPVTLGFADGQQAQMTVGAIYDADDVAGPYVLPREVWSTHTPQTIDSTVLVSLRDGVSQADGRAAIEKVADEYHAGDVMNRAQYVDKAAGSVDQILGLVYVMLFLAIVIALMGIANTLALAVYERTNEIGLMRAVGTTRAQMRSMVRWESVIVSVFGTLAGIAVGVFLGWGLVRVASAAGGLDGFAIPVVQLVIVVVVGAIAGVLAGIRPARRAARLDVLQAVATT